MNFSHALEHLKSGKRVRDRIWPTGQFLALQKGYPNGIPINDNTAAALHIAPRTIKKFPAYLIISKPNGDCYPWTPQHTEILSNLWDVIGDDDA